MKKLFVLLIMVAAFSTLMFGAEAKAKVAMPVVGIEQGNVIPNFTLVDLNGKKSNIKDYYGKIVFLNFWATWCPPCRQEMPSMQKLFDKQKGKDFVMLAVSVDQGATKEVADFITKNKYKFPVFHDTDGTLSQLFLIRSIPTTFILDKKGVILEKSSGAEDWSDLDVDKLLNITKGK